MNRLIRRHSVLLVICLACVATVAAPALAAGEFAARLGDIENGTVRLAYPTRDEAVDHHRTIRLTDAVQQPVVYGDVHDRQALVELVFRNGRVREIDLWQAQRWRRPCADCLDLGQVDPAQAAAWFMEVARGRTAVGSSIRRSGKLAEDALTAAAMARDAELAEPLLDIAREHGYGDDLRQSAIIWLAVLAADQAAGPLRELTGSQQESADVREAAVIALAQLPDDESIPILMAMAREHPHPEVQRMALLMLGQHGTPEVIDLLTEILLD